MSFIKLVVIEQLNNNFLIQKFFYNHEKCIRYKSELIFQ